jgi:succinylarginine dihydrolase
LEIFVYGQRATDPSQARPVKFPARQTREASEAIARLHQLAEHHTIFVQQNPAAIDAGIFHNDVAAVGNLNVLMFHELAYADPLAINKIRAMYEDVYRAKLFLLEAKEKDFPLAAAVETYLFNSQLISLPSGKMALIAPIECQGHPPARGFIEKIIAEDNPVALVDFVDVRQSMQNGGGPACLRLRVVMNELELTRVRKTVFLDEVLFAYLSKWIVRHYRESLTAEDLADPLLLTESRTALDELTKVLGLGAVYEFQRGWPS